MPLDYEIRDGNLRWIRNPFTGVISYVVDVRAKSFAFTLGARETADSPEAPARIMDAEEIQLARAACPFCPGNEERSPPEIMRMEPGEVDGSDGSPGQSDAPWVIRAFNNLFPRVPEELTGGRNESYVVVEDPRHFLDRPRSHHDLLFTGALSERHFLKLLAADAAITRQSLRNPAVRSVVVRKNQGRESGASQPHVHQQIIGAPVALPVIAAESAAQRENPGLWHDLAALMEELGLMIERRDGAISYASPIGAFPRSYDIVMPEFCGLIGELDDQQLAAFASLLHRVLRVLGPLPLDYEIHQGDGLPLHAHVNARLYPYSNVAGTLNLPNTLLENVAAIRRMLSRR
jgi:UDPglucose--hexose-1-phosphate uridylyltransferase